MSTSNILFQTLTQQIKDNRQINQHRSRDVLQHSQGINIRIDGKNYISFCSNDYLGLSTHPEVIESLQKNAGIYGVGSGASPLISGYREIHEQCERKFAKWLGRERALLCSSGFAANLSILSTMARTHSLILADKKNHASLIDGMRLANTKFFRYPHGNIDVLENYCQKFSDKSKIIVSDGVFSMDGDLAPLPELIRCAKKYQALLIIDDAHGLGTIGQHGKGIIEHYGVNNSDVPILICPLGKAFGCSGAIIAANSVIIENLIQFARPYIYSTAIPPALAAAATESLRIMQKESHRREKLHELIDYFQAAAKQRGLPILPSISPIQILMTDDAKQALLLGEKCLKHGFFIKAIRPPTVPTNRSRLRITLHVEHQPTQIDHLIDILMQYHETKK